MAAGFNLALSNPVPGQEADRGAAPGQRHGGRVPDPGGRPGDDDGLAVEAGQVRRGELGQQGGPGGQADPGETRDNERVQGGVHGRPPAGHGASPGRCDGTVAW